ncbi:MAG: hypothetical protein K5765_00525 [Clostridia bacterium]|nr:hypothetical protein [Clostridia bacterium]
MDIVKFYLLFIVFTGTSLSNATFVYNDPTVHLYTFTQLPIIKGYHITLLLFLSVFIVFIKERKIFRTNLSNNKKLKNTLILFILLFIFGIFFGIISMLINDNQMMNHFDLWFVLYRRDLLLYFNILLIMTGISYSFLACDELKNKFEDYFLIFMFSISIATILSVLFGWSADYGSGTTLLLSQASIFSVFLVIYPFYSNKKNSVKVLAFILGIVSSLCMLFKTSELAGKWWIIIFIVFILVIYKSIISNRLGIIIIGTILIALSIFSFISLMHNEIGFGLSEAKLKQFSSVINIFGSNWYDNLSASPKSRIDELVNVFLEYVEKPLYLPFGKGFASSFIRRFGTSDWSITSSGTFSQLELKYQVFANMHETVNSLILSFGLFGIVILIREFSFFIKNLKMNFFGVLGFVWFIFFFTTGYSALYVGLCCFIFSKIDRRRCIK